MLIREYTETDLDVLRAIHAAQGFHYGFPDLRNPLFVTKLVLSNEDVAAGFSPASSPDVAAGFSPASSLDVAAGFSPASSLDVAAGFSPASSPDVAALKDAALRGGATQVTLAPEDAKASGEGNCRILGAAFLRLTAEAYLLLDPRAGTPRERWQWLLALHQAARRDAWQRGLEDVHAWLPPPIARKFGRRLERLGWRRDDAWTPYCTKLVGK